jgi:hypothetical protein
MNPNDIHEASWMFRFFIGAVNWLNPIVQFVGLGIALCAFFRCRKKGYLVIAFYFALAIFLLLAWPPISRVIRAHHPQDISAQTQQKIDAAVKQAIDQVLAKEGHPVFTRNERITFPLASIVLVIGLWLLGRSEPKGFLETKANVP